jgi:bifunctional enzyme CysN/CysC
VSGVDEPIRRLLDLPAVAADVQPAEPETVRRAPADSFRATVVWSAAAPLLPGRSYEMRLSDRAAVATIAPLYYRLDPENGRHVAATTLSAGEVGVCDLELSESVSATAGTEFVLRDRITGDRVGGGRVQFALRRSQNVRWQAFAVDKAARAARAGQRPAVVWLTGLSGAGKSTIANRVEAELHRRGHATYLLDGDNVRHGLNSDLGFTAADRVENIRRVAEVAALMADAGLIVLVSFISPFRAERLMARSLVADGEFFEVHVDAPLAVVESRDPKGLYGKARRGELSNFTGIDSPYEPPQNPDLHVRTDRTDAGTAAHEVIELLAEAGRLSP